MKGSSALNLTYSTKTCSSIIDATKFACGLDQQKPPIAWFVFSPSVDKTHDRVKTKPPPYQHKIRIALVNIGSSLLRSIPSICA